MGISKSKKKILAEQINKNKTNAYKCINFLLMNDTFLNTKDKENIIMTIVALFNYKYEEAEYIYRLFMNKYSLELNTLKILETKNNRRISNIVDDIPTLVQGNNGTYEIYNNGILLKNNNGYLYFESKKEVMEFFKEIMTGCELMNVF